MSCTGVYSFLVEPLWYQKRVFHPPKITNAVRRRLLRMHVRVSPSQETATTTNPICYLKTSTPTVAGLHRFRVAISKNNPYFAAQHNRLRGEWLKVKNGVHRREL